MNEANANRDAAPCRRFIVSGRVQGVWFRDSTRQQAERLGLCGHALNLRDGTVEVLVCGRPVDIEELVRWLHVGPPLARVASVVEGDCGGDSPSGFSTG